MKKSPTKNLLILVTLLVVTFLSVIAFGIYIIVEKNKTTAALLREVEAGSNSSILTQSIRSAESDPNSEIALLNNISLQEDKLISFIELIESRAKALGLKVKITSVSIEPGAGEGQPQKINIRIETSGLWAPSFQFQHEIENLPYRTIINSSSLEAGEILSDERSGSSTTPATKSSLRTIWKSNISLSLYSFK